MALKLSWQQLDAIQQHGARDYPSECCGVLLGKTDGGEKEVTEVVPLKNLRHDPARAQELLPVDDLNRETDRNRFLVDPLEQLRVEKGARARGLEVLGYYHSHPDHPARPSQYDREHAWPWYAYLILSVEKGTAKELTCWVLAEDQLDFEADKVIVS
jgi:proteasome lid subunit RPN8/RPN11